ncbi:hypothetical protein [Nocardioides albidus]|nr:hypothetical protein [Nocardioides albidus]
MHDHQPEEPFDAHDARFDQIDSTLAEILRRLPEPPTGPRSS